ncbi:MAG: DNA polymerase III subunit chi [Rhodospirillaceae bacterium]|nr:DNA polymerase III subunit chi [Rhodospirillaceae bacterium]
MTEIRFYHLFSMPLEKALPVLLEKVVERHWRALIVTDSLKRVSELDSRLWTYKPSSFLPHGMVGDKDAELQPILLTHKDENSNDANVLFLVDGAESKHIGKFEICCLLFDGNDTDGLIKVREAWASYKNEGHKVIYLQQEPSGKWSEKRTVRD